MHVQPAYGISVRPGTTAYDPAHGPVCRLPGGALAAGRSVRLEIGALSAAMPETLCKLFPELDREVAVRVTRPFGGCTVPCSRTGVVKCSILFEDKYQQGIEATRARSDDDITKFDHTTQCRRDNCDDMLISR